MHIALIADAYPPMRTSAAVQLHDLSQELVRQGHKPTVIIPSSNLTKPWVTEYIDGVQVMRLKALPTKDIDFIRRTINEFLLPFAMLHNLRKSTLANVRWDGVAWYSPTIFLGPLVSALKKASNCRSYLIIRDIFPEWAVDMGLMRRGIPYFFFKAVAHHQYSVADVIGVQTPGNLAFFTQRTNKPRYRVEVLQNWLANSPNVGSSISVKSTKLNGRIIFVYAGNMGIAQGVGILIDLAASLQHRRDIGFLFVGRGSDSKSLRDKAKQHGLDNVFFHEEINPTEIPGLYAQCNIGIVALDPRHKTHNIPGKFLSYMQAGLPVLANINAGNDLAEIIEKAKVGLVCTNHSVDTLSQLAIKLAEEVTGETNMPTRCKALSAKLFSPRTAAKQIIAALSAPPSESNSF